MSQVANSTRSTERDQDMNKRELVLAALAAGGGGAHSPVQVQKLLFIVQKNVGGDTGTPFTFRPYDYGPFDASVYDVLRQLESEGLAAAQTTSRGWKIYKLTAEGQQQGAALLDQEVDGQIRRYIQDVSAFVRGHSFADLVSAVYKAYPEMKVNSVFRG